MAARTLLAPRGRILLAAALAATVAGCMPPSWGANAVLHPARRTQYRQPTQPYQELRLRGDGIDLPGWIFRATTPRRGTVIYLHGVASNRSSSLWTAQLLTPRGFDVVAYDGRAHGTAGGDACTYGVREKADLARVLDQLGDGPFVLLGHSLGAAVALQAAAGDARIAGVVAASSFSDLRTAASERAPFFASRANIDEAFTLVQKEGRFLVDEASPVRVAPQIRCPVLLIHGSADTETPPAHAQRIDAALISPRKLLLIPGARHNDVFRTAWPAVEQWLDEMIPRAAPQVPVRAQTASPLAPTETR